MSVRSEVSAGNRMHLGSCIPERTALQKTRRFKPAYSEVGGFAQIRTPQPRRHTPDTLFVDVWCRSQDQQPFEWSTANSTNPKSRNRKPLPYPHKPYSLQTPKLHPWTLETPKPHPWTLQPKLHMAENLPRVSIVVPFLVNQNLY